MAEIVLMNKSCILLLKEVQPRQHGLLVLFQLGNIYKEVIPILAHVRHKLSEVAKDIRAGLLFFKGCRIVLNGSFLMISLGTDCDSRNTARCCCSGSFSSCDC